MTTHTTTLHVLGGLPVTIEFSLSGPDPDVGIFQTWISDWSVTEINGRRTKSTWVEDRIHASPRELARLYEELLSSTQDCP